jgi:hypothetical protein
VASCYKGFYPTRLIPSETYDFLRSRFPLKLKMSDILNSVYFYWFLLAVIVVVIFIMWLQNRNPYVPIIPTPVPSP